VVPTYLLADPVLDMHYMAGRRPHLALHDVGDFGHFQKK